MEIRKLEIDFDESKLKINGEEYKERPLILTLPGADGWPLYKLFNESLCKGNPEECDRLKICFDKANFIDNHVIDFRD